MIIYLMKMHYDLICFMYYLGADCYYQAYKEFCFYQAIITVNDDKHPSRMTKKKILTVARGILF